MDVNASLGAASGDDVSLSARLRGILPWPERASRPSSPTDQVGQLIKSHRHVHPGADTALLRRAYVTADRAHAGQFRKSGEPYVTHPLAVAQILAELGMDTTTLAAALLHDTVEDTSVQLDTLRADFGTEVAHLVDGVTKFEKSHFGAIAEAETIRKMIIWAGRDVRVLVIKLADRLHNMRTLDARSPASRARIAGATREVLVPLCDRLGIQALKRELEDVVLAYLEPETYATIDALINQRPQWNSFLSLIISSAEQALRADRVDGRVEPRHRHHYTIWRDTQARGAGVPHVDMPRIVVLVDGPEGDCYTALGAIHGMWRPVPGRFKDFIAAPKNNLYRSLHTTVLGPERQPVEVLIRTEEMHRDVEWGIVARFRFPTKVLPERLTRPLGVALGAAWPSVLSKTLPDAVRKPLTGAIGMLTGDTRSATAAAAAAADAVDLDWLRRVIELEQDTDDAMQFVRSLRCGLAETQIQVICRGKHLLLPEDSTPIDVAYELGTSVGDRVMGATVNGEMAPLTTPLTDGDVVEVYTGAKGKETGPYREWLDHVKAPKAQLHLRRRFAEPDAPAGTIADRIAIGRAALGLALRRRSRGLANDEWLHRLVAQFPDYPDLDTLLVAIADHKLSAETAVDQLIALVDNSSGHPSDVRNA